MIPHQANIRIMQSTARKLKLSMDKVIVTVDQHGNTSAASIPLALDSAVRSGRVKPGELLLLEGVGGGFTWGAVLLDYWKPIPNDSFRFRLPRPGLAIGGHARRVGGHPAVRQTLEQAWRRSTSTSAG